MPSDSLQIHLVFPAEVAAGTLHGYSGRGGGCSSPPYRSLNLGDHVGDDAEAVRRNRATFSQALGVSAEKWVTAEQIHGGAVARVGLNDAGRKIPGMDALITDVPGLPLALMYADCLSIFLIDPKHRAIGLAHAGWRGTAAEIGPRTVEAMAEAFGSDPGDLRAAFGPHIGPCCYAVGREVADAFAHWDGAIWVNDGPPRADLGAANRVQLLEAGLREDHLFTDAPCTACHADSFFSYRRDGLTGRMAAVLSVVGSR